MSSRLRNEIHEQKLANESTLPYAQLYASHRQHLTARVLRAQSEKNGLSLCLLGAGNCHDVDLAALAEHYAEVHLVDIDEVALEHACSVLTEDQRGKVVRHAPVDLSGMLSILERWQRFEITPEELMVHPTATAEQLQKTLGGPFDVVVSACVVTQMQLAVLNTLTDQHRLFPAVRHTLTVTHLRTLSQLTRSEGRALLVTDLVDTSRVGLKPGVEACELRSVFDRALGEGNVIYVAHPGVFKAVIDDDPLLKHELATSEIEDVWLWQQGPNRSFLVYAMDLARRNTASA